MPYRFVRGRIDAATPGKIIESTSTDIAGARAAAEAPLKQGVDQLAAVGASATGPLADLYRHEAGSLVSGVKERFDMARSRLTDTVSLLEAALTGAGLSLAGTDLTVPLEAFWRLLWLNAASLGLMARSAGKEPPSRPRGR